MTHRSAVLTSVGLWMLLFAATSGSRADTTLFTNFGAGFSYNTSVGNPIGNAFDGNLYAEGDSFSPSSSTMVSSIYLALSCDFASGCPDSFTVSLTRDAGDQPGASFESFTVSGGSLGLLGVNNAPLILTSISDPSLTAGTRYWVTVSSDSNDTIAWNLSPTGDISDAAISSDGGVTWFSPSGLTPGALQVNGVTTTTSVPEPDTVVLLISGLLLLAPGRRLAILPESHLKRLKAKRTSALKYARKMEGQLARFNKEAEAAGVAANVRCIVQMSPRLHCFARPSHQISPHKAGSRTSPNPARKPLLLSYRQCHRKAIG